MIAKSQQAHENVRPAAMSSGKRLGCWWSTSKERTQCVEGIEHEPFDMLLEDAPLNGRN
jgi:hypothetical protein